ncbi:MAG: T9SS type A sorting domain-containing protein [Bacteroidia bacterium]|nr:T9SS type A sorting domain-containing protein [Bacteroidia bacterium]
MKRLIFCLIPAFFALSSNAQTDTVSMTPGYAEQVFFSTVTGLEQSAQMMDWDIAFATHAQEVGIRINDVNGVALYKVPNLTTAGWAQVDTAGISNWDSPTNSIEDWMTGAFNRNSLGPFDYGWGVYNPGTHEVNGDSLYVIELTPTTGPSTFKKLWIEKKSVTNQYIFRHANLDGTNETIVTITASNYSSQNFVYHSIRNGVTLSREPATTDWNITFTRYLQSIPGFGFYPVTGVFSNVGVEVAEARNIDVNTVQYSTYDTSYTAIISEIGDDWKSFNGVSFDVEDSLVYFVKSQDDGISKLRFIGFEGSTTGNIILEATVLTTSITEIENSTLQSLALYPTVSSDQVHLVFSLNQPSELLLSILSIDGRVVDQQHINSPQGLNNILLDVSSYSSGYYVMSLTSATDQLNSKFIISR